MLFTIAAIAVILLVVQAQIDLLVAPELTKTVKIVALVVAVFAGLFLFLR